MKKGFRCSTPVVNALLSLVVTALYLVAAPAPAATLTTPNWIASHMVLQREMTVPIWGTGVAGNLVTVSFNGQTLSTTVGADGKWRVNLASMPATATPGTMTISSGVESRIYTDVQVGEVWGCSGQSNMELTLSSSDGGAAAAADAPNHNIRLFIERGNTKPTDSGVTWKVANATTAGGFSAVGYYFGRELSQSLGVPIGLIDAGKSGTPIEYWSHAAGSGKLYDTKIAPLIPYAIRGFIWYQGEDNSRDSTAQYYAKLKGLINEWRTAWGQGDFPFGIVQLPMGRKQATRDAQLQAFLTIPNTLLAITTDLPSLGGQAAHPANKRPIGLRLAIGARSQVYGENVEPVGPLPDDDTSYVVGNKAVIGFTDVGDGLVTGSEWQPAGAPVPVYLAGADGRFYPATATIVGNTLEATSPAVPNPVYVRYTWEYAMGNLYSAVNIPMEGSRSTYTRLPAVSFGIKLNPRP